MKLSIVDLSAVLPRETRHDAFLQSIEVTQHVERLGYERIWVAEHHGAGSVAGRAPEVLIAALAATRTCIIVQDMMTEYPARLRSYELMAAML
jgi:hypothetical protein